MQNQSNKTNSRHTWSNTLIYVLTVAGATIGFGATWRFPYLVGENGGGAYVAVFIIAMIVIGIPMILVENVIGRRAHANSLDAFSPAMQGKKFSKMWKIAGVMGLIGCFGIIAYYMVLGGWVLTYLWNLISGGLDVSVPLSATSTREFYLKSIEYSPLMVSIYTLIFVWLNYIVLSRGISNGIEKAMKVLMPLLFIFLIGIAAKNLTMPGALEGVKFYLMPDFSKISPKLFIAVLGQVFFALSLGFGVMITLSSYLDKGENMLKTALSTGILNTIIALLAGFMIFPSLFSFGLEPDSGPKLVFEVLPVVFSHISFGAFIGAIFFSLLLIAAFTTSITLYEVLITVAQEKLALSRKLVTILVLAATFVCGNLPCILAYGKWREVMIFGRNIFDTFDFVSGNIFFVLTALLTSVFVGWVLGNDAKEELQKGCDSPKIISLWFVYVKYVIPLVILVVFISGVV